MALSRVGWAPPTYPPIVYQKWAVPTLQLNRLSGVDERLFYLVASAGFSLIQRSISPAQQGSGIDLLRSGVGNAHRYRDRRQVIILINNPSCHLDGVRSIGVC